MFWLWRFVQSLVIERCILLRTNFWISLFLLLFCCLTNFWISIKRFNWNTFSISTLIFKWWCWLLIGGTAHWFLLDTCCIRGCWFLSFFNELYDFIVTLRSWTFIFSFPRGTSFRSVTKFRTLTGAHWSFSSIIAIIIIF